MTIFHRHPAIPSGRNKYTKIHNFKPLTNDKVKREIKGMKNKGYELDQISILMLKDICMDVSQSVYIHVVMIIFS